jgi:hypothetical protein
VSELAGRGAAWTEERGTSDEGRRRPKAPRQYEREAEHDGLTVTHRRYVPASHAHYGGNLVDGAYVLSLFGDVATEACVRMDGDEGLFASYAAWCAAPTLAAVLQPPASWTSR